MSLKKIDILLYGSTGFTGKLVAAYLDTHPHLKNKTWAIAGRTESKLQKLKSTLTSDPLVICCPLDDDQAVTEMVKRCRVIITCAGPYSLYSGDVLLGACAENGVHYSDLAGEAFFQRKMITKYHAIAQKTGAKICLGGGIDSIPSDIGAMMVLNALPSTSTDVIAIQGIYTRYCGAFSGGTINSGRAGKKARKGVLPGYPYSNEVDKDPYVLTAGAEGIEKSTSVDPSGMQNKFSWLFNASYGVICSFFMAPINARVVRRSFVLRNEHNRISYAEACSLFMWIHVVTVWALRGFGYFVCDPINFSPKSGEGPPAWLLKNGQFCVEVVATNKTTGVTAKAVVAGKGDPGYGATSKLLSELGLCLAFDDHSGSECDGGVLTPSTAVGVVYVDRLKKATFMNSIEVVSGGKTE